MILSKTSHILSSSYLISSRLISHIFLTLSSSLLTTFTLLYWNHLKYPRLLPKQSVSSSKKDAKFSGVGGRYIDMYYRATFLAIFSSEQVDSLCECFKFLNTFTDDIFLTHLIRPSPYLFRSLLALSLDPGMWNCAVKKMLSTFVSFRTR